MTATGTAAQRGTLTVSVCHVQHTSRCWTYSRVLPTTVSALVEDAHWLHLEKPALWAGLGGRPQTCKFTNFCISHSKISSPQVTARLRTRSPTTAGGHRDPEMFAGGSGMLHALLTCPAALPRACERRRLVPPTL